MKVTGGGTKTGAVGAHFAYITRKGNLAIEPDEGDRITGRDAQKALLNDWHLELSAGQYRAPRDGRVTARRVKLVHNIVFSMPFPTPWEKALAAAQKFAREKFALGTDTRWRSTPIKNTRTCTWSSKPKATRGADCTSTRPCCANGGKTSRD